MDLNDFWWLANSDLGEFDLWDIFLLATLA
jgi:hypothetical protein